MHPLHYPHLKSHHTQLGEDVYEPTTVPITLGRGVHLLHYPHLKSHHTQLGEDVYEPTTVLITLGRGVHPLHYPTSRVIIHS